jgi:hypothetical protein
VLVPPQFGTGDRPRRPSWTRRPGDGLSCCSAARSPQEGESGRAWGSFMVRDLTFPSDQTQSGCLLWSPDRWSWLHQLHRFGSHHPTCRFGSHLPLVCYLDHQPDQVAIPCHCGSDPLPHWWCSCFEIRPSFTSERTAGMLLHCLRLRSVSVGIAKGFPAPAVDFSIVLTLTSCPYSQTATICVCVGRNQPGRKD